MLGSAPAKCAPAGAGPPVWKGRAMAGYFEGLFNGGATQALTSTLAYTQARHRVIAENVANLTTPNYKAKQLDYGEFQKTLGRALAKRGGDTTAPVRLEGSGVFSTDAAGRLQVKPRVRPGRNLVFHDGTNGSVEREMSELAANAVLHETTTTLLGRQLQTIRSAIQGRV